MVHGLPGTWGDWNEVTAALPGRHTIAIDRPGFAYSSDDYLAYDDQLIAIHELTKKLGLKRPVIAGHSYGGTLALGYALAYPRETRAIVLVDAADDPDGGSKFELAQAYSIKFLQLPVIKTVADWTFSQALRTASANAGGKQAFDPNPEDEQFHKRLIDLNMQSEDVASWADEQTAFGGVIDELDPQVPSIKTPAFIVQGRDDQLVSLSSAKRLHKRLPNSRLVVVQGGHMATYDHPDVVAAQIKAASR
jgi:pimeloyl-ACP methyl ester carboxylesterase